MKALLALILTQAVAISPPPQTATITLPHEMRVTATTQAPSLLIPVPSGPGPHPLPPLHLLPSQWFDGDARAALIVRTPSGFRVTVCTANGQHISKDFVEQTLTLDASMK